MASFDMSVGDEVVDDSGFDIPVYGDDGVVVETTPSVPPARSAVANEHVHKPGGGHEGCERCAGKFVYKRKPRSQKTVSKPNIAKIAKKVVKAKAKLRR